MKFDDKEDLQIPAHGRELDRGRIGLFTIFSLSRTVSEEPPLMELVNAKTEDTSFKVEASVRLNRPLPTFSKKAKENFKRRLPSLRTVNKAVGYLGVLNTREAISRRPISIMMDIARG